MKKKPAGRMLLSIDWDFFFPIPEYDPHMLYDWGHSEDSNLFYDVVWTIRAANLLRLIGELPGTSGEEKSFWNRFKFNEQATLFYSESHKDILHPLIRPYTENIFNFDAHHDAGYGRPLGRSASLRCDNWVEYFKKKGSDVLVVYPAWKPYAFEDEPTAQAEIERVIDDGRNYEQQVDAVFVCRSGAWTPGWLDDDFDDFLMNCPLSRQIQVGELIEREWESDTAREMASKMKQLIETSSERKSNDEIT